MIFNTIGSGLIGAVIGAVVVLASVTITHHYNAKRDKDNREKIVFNYIQALHDELDVFWQAFKTEIGYKLMAASKDYALTEVYPKIDTQFIIYEGNVDILGGIKDEKLRRRIVQVYSALKAFRAQLSFHNKLIIKYENTYWKQQKNNDPNLQKYLEKQYETIKFNTSSLISQTNTIEKSISGLLKELNKHAVLSNQSF